jgi:hypothetical protein
MRLQTNKGLESYISCETDLTINGNVSSVRDLDEYDFSGYVPPFLISKILSEHYDVRKQPLLDPRKVCLVHSQTKLSLTDKEGWENDPLYDEYSKYKDNVLDGMGEIVMIHPNVLNSFGAKATELFNLDGMHRIMSTLEAGGDTIPTMTIMLRDDLVNHITDDDKTKIFEYGGKATWFPRYQQLKEVGLEGERNQEPRFSSIYNFNELKGKTVADFGCNLGQAVMESVFNGAKGYGFEYQQEVVDTSNEIRRVLGIDVEFNQCDFNAKDFEEKVNSVVPEQWDCLLFLAIYRTREINNVEKNFDYLVSKTKETIFFEGHANPIIDTQEFYNNKFLKYNFKRIDYLGMSDQRPVWRIEK